MTGDSGCDTGQHPNGTSDGALQGGLSHEHNESTTDPFPNTAWADYTTGPSTGYENGDKCGGAFGSQLGTAPNGSPYNQLINGHEYLYQQEWSNQGHSCRQRFTFSGAEPTAQFTSTPGSGNAMSFDATGSTAPGGVAHYHWEFENTQPAVSETETTTPTTSHTYSASGPHTVSLTVFAPDGTSYGTSRVINTGAAGPTASFSVNPTQAVTGSPAAFTSSSSAPAGDSISQQTWSFGDGASGSGDSVSHAYAATGNYPVTLTVTTMLGQTTSTTQQLHVAEPPAAAFTLTPTRVPAGSPVTFDGSDSSQAGGSIAGYRWSFGDGASASGVTTSHAYAQAGTYTTTLSAADPFGNAAAASHQVLVVGTPSALITAGANPIARVAESLSGVGSTDHGSTLSSYDWRFGDAGVGSGATLSHTYAHPGVYRTTLTVTDASGVSIAATRALIVRSASIASISVKKGRKLERLTVVVTGPGTLSVGKHRFKLGQAGRFVYKLGLSNAQRNRLRHHQAVKIKLTIKFEPTAGSSSSRTVRFKIRG